MSNNNGQPASSSQPNPPGGTEQALQFFNEKFHAPATHLVYAPGRVNLIGEHTDYNGGFVLPMAIEVGVFIAARPRTDDMVRVWSSLLPGQPAEFSVREPVRAGAPSWSNYVRGVLAGLQGESLAVPGFDAAIHASLPLGGGLSSSAALEVATATLGELLTGVTLDPVKKALLCQKAEHDYAGTPCGIMDQFSVVFARQGHLLLIDCQSLERQPVPMRGDDAAILIINTMVKHELTDGGYRSRREDCHEAARLLGVQALREVSPEQVDASRAALAERLFRRARHVTTEDARTLAAVNALRQGAWSELGGLMYASHESLRLDFEVSCAELDAVVRIARELGEAGGVYGCRMTGGGFGGCCVALVRADRVAKISEIIREQNEQATGIKPTLFVTRPAGGPIILRKP